MKRILSVLLAVCTALTTLCIPPAPVTAQSTETAETLVSEQIDQAVTLPVEEEPITLETLTEDCKILQYVDEEAFAAADHAFRLPYLEELDTYVFQNTDGTRSIYYLYENVKFYDEQGNIREKDNTLQRETKGFRITENEFDLLLPHAVTDGVELTYQGYDVKLVPATGETLTATAFGTLQENSVVYESFFGAGTSLVYTPLLSGVKEEIILEEYLPNKSFSFLLYTDGLFLNNTDGSYILAESKASTEAVLYLGNIVVYDAIGRPSLGNLTVETIKDGNIYALTVSADEAFLSDPATVYPVTIDPDITISDTDNGDGAIEDTTIFSGTPNLNAGDWVRNTAGYVDETYGAGRILVRLPGLYNDEVYQGLTADRILSATFYTTKSSSKTPDYVNLYRCTSIAWGETEATWNNSANLYATDANWGTASTSSSTVSFNITTLVKYWKNRYLIPATGFMLVNQNETNTNKKFGIYASEYSATEKRPYFVLDYDEGISLNKASTTIAVGNKETLVATTYPAGGTVTWTSGDESIAVVNSSGVVRAIAFGSVTVTATYIDSEDNPHTAQCTVLVIPLAEGTYILQNRQTHVYADVAAQIAIPGAVVQQWEFHGGATQKWELTYISNRYYTVRIEKNGVNYYMGVEGNSQITDSNIVLRTGVVDDGMLWRFESTTDGAYRIVPKLAEAQTTERALVATTSNNTNGDRLAYGNYVANNGSYRDEWYVKTVEGSLGEFLCWNSTELSIGFWEETPTIYVGDLSGDTSVNFASEAELSLEQWATALEIQFVYASEDEADIKCYRLTSEQYYAETGLFWDPTVAGITWSSRRKVGFAYFLNSEIKVWKYSGATIYILQDTEYEPSIEVLRDTITHEFGHALGYRGHSENPEGVMYPSVHADYFLKADEISHLKQIYDLVLE